MNRRKVNLSAVILWGVVAYAIALLTYCTMNKFLKSSTSADDISAFGSILGACGAFFAAFVATYLFNDWKVQHNKNLERDAAFKALSIIESQHFPLKRLSGDILKIRDALKKGFTAFEKTMSENSDPEFIEKLRYNIRTANFLCDDKNTSPLLEVYIEKYTSLKQQTLFFISIHNGSKKALNLNDEDAPLITGVYERMEIMKPNNDEPVPYEQKAKEYNQAFEELSEHLFQKGKA